MSAEEGEKSEMKKRAAMGKTQKPIERERRLGLVVMDEGRGK